MPATPSQTIKKFDFNTEQQVNSNFGSTSAQSSNSSTGIYLLIIFITVIVVVFFVNNYRKKLKREAALQKTALKITLPKPNDEEDRRDPKEVIGIMEQLFSSLHHFYINEFWKRFWHGNPIFSFEITAMKGEIFFYVVTPNEFVDQIERQIHSGFSSAQVEVAKDHDIFLEKGGISTVGALKLNRGKIFPIKTYKSLENDPLNGITNAISKLHQGKAAIQILVQPIEQVWQNDIQKALQNVQQGKQFDAGNGAFQKVGRLLKEVGSAAAVTQGSDSGYNEAQNIASGNVRLTALQEQQAKLMTEKGSKIGFRVQVRCLAKSETEIDAKNQVQNMLSAFAQFNSPEANGFRATNLNDRKLLVNYILRTFSKDQSTMLLNTEELTSIYHFPNRKLDTPNINWLKARRLAPPSNLPKEGLKLGFSSFRGMEIPVYCRYEDRTRHLYMIGKTGVGKTNMFENMIVQDIRSGAGVCYMDPNGDAVEWIIRHIPKERAEDVIILDPSDTGRPIALNLLEFDPKFPEQKTMVINEMISIFDKLYDLKSTGGPMFEQYMRNAMLLIMDDPESGSTLMEISKVLADESFRKMKLSKSRNQIVIDFWTKEAEKAGGEAALANMVPYITSKLTQFTSNDIMRPIIGQQKSAFNFRQIMDEKKILLVTLPKGLLGEMNARLLGMIISGKIQIAAFSRQNQLEADRVPFYLYVDEFQNFTSKTFATILSEARKYQLSLNITNQYVEQLDEETRNAVMGNVGTMIVWRVGAADAEFFKKEFDSLELDDMVNMEKYNFYVKLLIDGSPSRPFNVVAYPPDNADNSQIGEAVRQLSRLKYGRDRELVEAEIRLRSRSVV